MQRMRQLGRLAKTDVGIVSTLAVLVTTLMPTLSFAAGFNSLDIVTQLANTLYNAAVGPAIGIAAIIGVWGLVRALFKGANNPHEHKNGLTTVVWCVIIIFVLVVLRPVLNFVHSVGNDTGNCISGTGSSTISGNTTVGAGGC